MTDGERIREARLEAGLSQKELARQVGLSPETISRYERRKGLVHPEVLEQLLAVTAREALAPHPPRKQPAPRKITCAHCGRVFVTTKQGRVKYCSDNCSREEDRPRRRERERQCREQKKRRACADAPKPKNPARKYPHPNCKGCRYLQLFAGAGQGCHYAVLTGQLRGCPAENCDKKVVRRPEE